MKRQSLIINLIFIDLIIASFLLIIYLSDVPVFIKPKEGKYAAIAIRDNVNAFQKFGTCLFSRNYLKRAYSESLYFTEGADYSNRKDFVKGLNELLNRNDSVDIYLLAHTNYYFEWVGEIDSNKRQKINLVYNTGCSGLMQESIWQKLGVAKYVAHQSEKSISPVFYFFFLKRYLSDEEISITVFDSNIKMFQKLSRIERTTFGILSVDEETKSRSQGTLRNYK